MKKELMKRTKGCKIRLISNMVLCIPFFILWGVYMLLGAAITPLSPMEDSYKIMETVERYIGYCYLCLRMHLLSYFYNTENHTCYKKVSMFPAIGYRHNWIFLS